MDSSVNSSTSRYVQGGTTEVGPIGLEWWEPKQFPTDSSDMSYVVEDRFAGDLRMISVAFYSTDIYWWVIAQYNAILDPIFEIVPGRVLIIPTLDRLTMFLSSKLGGIPSTRVDQKILPPVIV